MCVTACPRRNPDPNPNPRYHKAPRLCRVWVLQVFKWLRSRGEFFVRYKNPNTGQWYDGRNVLAHAFLLKYIDIHDPSLSARFGPKGAFNTTNLIIWKLRRYVVGSLSCLPNLTLTITLSPGTFTVSRISCVAASTTWQKARLTTKSTPPRLGSHSSTGYTAGLTKRRSTDDSKSLPSLTSATGISTKWLP